MRLPCYKIHLHFPALIYYKTYLTLQPIRAMHLYSNTSIQKMTLTLKALAIYKKSDLFLAKIKTEQQFLFGSNLVWRSTARNLYEHAIEACYANNNMEDAFYFFEKSRSILLNDQINEQRWMADIDIANQAAIKKTLRTCNEK